MVKLKHLTHAPITEALIDIKVKLPPDFDVTQLKSIHTLISKEYPKEQELRKKRFEFKVKPDSVEASPSYIHGYRYISTDKERIVQARLNGFTFSKLKPYKSWEHLRDEAHRLWSEYVKLFRPKLITRVAVRYINRLEIPFLPKRDFKYYLTAPPEVPKELPQEVSGFLTRIVIPMPLDTTAIIAQAMEPIKDPKILPIILDIDVFKGAKLNTDRDAWDALERFHDLKNDIFFSSVTKKALELWQ